MPDIKTFFEAAYERGDRYWWKEAQRYSATPDHHGSSLITQQTLRWAAQRTPGRVLDVGAGEGADAIRMALLGWKAIAIELTENGVDRIRTFAREIGADVTARQGDLDDLGDLDEEFDLVICNGVLHYVDNKVSACATLQRLTAPGGANAVSLWSDYTPIPECHQVVPTFPDAEYGEVWEAYRPWEKQLYYLERRRLEESHTDMPSHVHSFIKMFALKPHESGLS